ncbi:MAG: hypothetical protein V4635_14400 [Bacteroidota bacterium]
MLKRFFIFTSLLTLLAACGTMKDSPKWQLRNGYYKSNSFSDKTKVVYVHNQDDSLFVYAISSDTKSVDTTQARIIFPLQTKLKNFPSKTLRKPSFDIDFVTIPFKYRPTQRGFPQQLNANLNGAIYFGFRNDIYRMRYNNDLFRRLRQIDHYGFSFGLFTGLGGTAINPSVTNFVVAYEYDGLAWSKGVAAIIGINNMTFGLALGFDDLLDSNRGFWIYQRKPWLGFVFGLNLN